MALYGMMSRLYKRSISRFVYPRIFYKRIGKRIWSFVDLLIIAVCLVASVSTILMALRGNQYQSYNGHVIGISEIIKQCDNCVLVNADGNDDGDDKHDTGVLLSAASWVSELTALKKYQLKEEKGHFLLVFNPIVAYYDQKGIQREALVYENHQIKEIFTKNSSIHEVLDDKGNDPKLTLSGANAMKIHNQDNCLERFQIHADPKDPENVVSESPAVPFWKSRKFIILLHLSLILIIVLLIKHMIVFGRIQESSDASREASTSRLQVNDYSVDCWLLEEERCFCSKGGGRLMGKRT